MHSSTAYISASHELRAVMDCRLDNQCRGPPIHIRYPDMERDLKRSTCSMLLELVQVIFEMPVFKNVSLKISRYEFENSTTYFK